MDDTVSGRRRGTTKWEAMLAAFDVLKTTLEGTEDDTEYLGMASYSSSATADNSLTTNYSNVRSTLRSKSPNGSTNITAGIQAGLPIMAGGRSGSDVEKVFVVMTDGLHNVGTGPMSLVNTINSYNYKVITITFGNDADQDGMEELAEACNGTHYHAPTGAELETIFENIGLGLDGLQYLQ